MVELVTTLGGHQDSWAHRFVGCLSPMRHRYSKAKTFHSLFEYDTVMNIMSVHPCSGSSESLDAMNVFIILL